MASARTKITFDTARKIGLGMPGVEEGTSYGSPALKIRGELMACIAVHKSAEANTLAVRMDFDQRDALIAEDPDTYYLKDHYVNYPVVLVRLARIHPDAVRDLLGMAWRFVTSKARDGRKLRESRPAKSRRITS